MVFFWLLFIIPLLVLMMARGVGIKEKKNKRIVVTIWVTQCMVGRFEEEGDELRGNTETLEGTLHWHPCGTMWLNFKGEKVVEATNFCAFMVFMEENHLVVHTPMWGGIFVGWWTTMNKRVLLGYNFSKHFSRTKKKIHPNRGGCKRKKQEAKKSV